MIKKYQDFINEEVGLSLDNLKKPSPDGVRGDTLVKKIKNEEPLSIEKGDEAILKDDIIDDLVDHSGNYSVDKAEKALKKGRLYKPDAFEEKNGKFRKFKLNQLSKTKEFGSTKGSSAGSKITRDQESIQTFLLAYTAQTGFFPELEEIEDLILNEKENPTYSHFYQVNNLNSDLGDLRSYYKSWKWTTEQFINEMLNPKSYEFHQIGANSELIKTIKDIYSKCCRKSLGKVINMAKWNPSDVWVVHQESLTQVLDELRKIDLDETSFIKLNNLMNKLFDKGYLFGISLKKISNSTMIKKKLIINGEANRPLYRLKQERAIDFNINNKTITLYVDKFLETDKKPIGVEKVIITNNASGYANINLEITSISSRQGKCNLATINTFLENRGANYIVEPYSNLRGLSVEEQTELLNQAIENLGESVFRKKEMNIVKELKESDLISRLQGIILCDILYKDIDLGSQIINNILLYALSIEWAFEDDVTICPKYYRVIEYAQQS